MIRSPAGFDGGDRIKRYLDYYQPSYGVMMLSAGQAFSPASLFAAGEQGVWYDPSDFSTMFQSSTGTTPVTAVEQPVGLILDKSKGLALGSALSIDWGAVSAGWTIIDASNLTAAATSTTESSSTIPAAAVLYLVTFDAVVNSGSFQFGFGSATSSFTITASGSYTYQLYRTGAGGIRWMPTSFTGSISNISIRPIAGNHATQATSASRPVLSARVNLLLATATLSTQNVTTLAATYTLSFSGTGTVTATGTNIGVYSAGSNSLVCTAGTLTLTVVGSVTSADLRVTNTGVGLPAYQAVVTSTNYDTTGFPYYLRFDGSDDSLATATFTPGTDKVQLFAGARKQSDAAQGIFAELGNGIGGTNAFNLEAPNAASPSYRWRSGGTVLQETIPSGFAAPITNVLAGTADISAPFVTVRINGVESATNTATQGTGSYNANILYIGRRAGTSLPFNGNLYSLIVRFGANLDASTISNTETWVNGKTKAF